MGMKRNALLGLVVLFAGCATTNVVQKSGAVSPLGVVAITSAHDIGWYGEQKKSGGLLGNIIEKAVDKKTGENAEQLIVDIEKRLRDTLAMKGVNVIEPSKIQGSDAYQKAKADKLLSSGGVITPSGYKIVNAQNKDLMAQLAKSVGLKSGLYAGIAFDKMMDTGVEKNGTAAAAVTLNVILVDEKGKAVLQKSFFGKSTKTFAIVGGVYKPSDLMSLFPEAADAACRKFADSFTE